jgi:hypothetical protein
MDIERAKTLIEELRKVSIASTVDKMCGELTYELIRSITSLDKQLELLNEQVGEHTKQLKRQTSFTKALISLTIILVFLTGVLIWFAAKIA